MDFCNTYVTFLQLQDFQNEKVKLTVQRKSRILVLNLIAELLFLTVFKIPYNFSMKNHQNIFTTKLRRFITYFWYDIQYTDHVLYFWCDIAIPITYYLYKLQSSFLNIAQTNIVIQISESFSFRCLITLYYEEIGHNFSKCSKNIKIAPHQSKCTFLFVSCHQMV